MDRFRGAVSLAMSIWDSMGFEFGPYS